MDEKNASIVEDLKRGKEDALRFLYNRFYNLLLSFAKHTINNSLLAEDFVQDAFCTLWENREKLNSDQPVQSYLYSIVYRRSVDFLRKQRSQANFANDKDWKLKELDLTREPFENLIISGIFISEAQELIQITLQRLPDQTREIFQLSRDHSMKNAEIAKKMGLSIKAIEYHISKTLQQLRHSLKDFL